MQITVYCTCTIGGQVAMFWAMRDWFEFPDENMAERSERFDVLLDVRIKKLRWGECLTLDEIAECSGMSIPNVHLTLVSAFKKMGVSESNCSDHLKFQGGM